MKILLGILFLFAFKMDVWASKVDTLSVASPSMHKLVKCVVVTPDSYMQSKNTKRTQKYPVVYLLHGYSDNYSGWIKKVPEIKRLVDQLQIIIVCPDGGYGSWYFDSPVNPNYRYETFVSRELLTYIDGHFSTIANRKGRAIAGLSMGGHGALYLAIRHSELYGAAVSMSGGVDFTPFPAQWDIAKYLGEYPQNAERWKTNTVQYLVGALKNNQLAISFECGVSDFFIDVNRKLHQTLLENKIDHDYTERPGAHNWPYWGNALPYQLLFLKRYFARP